MGRFQGNQGGRRKQLMVCDMLLFGCSRFKYRFIKLDLVIVGKFDSVDVNPVRTQCTRGEQWLVRCAERVRTNKSKHRPNIHEKDLKFQQAISQIV